MMDPYTTERELSCLFCELPTEVREAILEAAAEKNPDTGSDGL